MNLKRKQIEAESEKWISKGIIDRHQAEKIIALYPEEKQRNWGTIVFTSIGAIIFGLGVILLFAYNWDKIHRLGKVALIVAALLSAHGTAIYFRIKSAKFAGLSEGLFALGTMFFGAGIWLVAQAYHIDDHYPNAFLVWGLGALLLAWALESSIQGMIASVIFTIWCGMEAFNFRTPQHFSIPLILLGIVLLAWKKRSSYLLFISIASFFLCLMFNGSQIFHRNFEIIFASWGALFIALSILFAKNAKFPQSSHVFAFFGQATYWVVLFVLTFPSACEGLCYDYEVEWKNFVQMAYIVVFLASALIAWAFIFLPVRRFKSLYGSILRTDHLLVPVTLLAISFNFGILANYDGKPGSLLFNAIYLFQCIHLINDGCKKSHAFHAILGTFLLACLAFARYADLFQSLLSRAIVFLIVGAAIFFIGVRYMKNKERIAHTGENPQ